MTFHRFAYKCCWKNRALLPAVFLLSSLGLVVILLHEATIELRPGGKIRVKYYLPGTVAPLVAAGGSVQPTVYRPAKRDHGPAKRPEDPLMRDHEAPEKQDVLMKPVQVSPRDGDSEVAVRWLENKPQIQDEVATTIPPLRVQAPDPPRGRKRHRARLGFTPVWRRSPYYNTSAPPDIFTTWRLYTDRFCDGRFTAFYNEFALLADVKLDREFCLSSKRGGEKISSVLNQAEESEYVTAETGCFQQSCKQRPSYYFNNNNHLNDWLYSIKTRPVSGRADVVQGDFVVAVVRHEYVNLYHTMSDWYNAFLLMQFFNKTQSETHVILVDAHPQGSLDAPWLVLFNSTRRLSALPKRTVFKQLVWSIIGYNSPLLDHYGPGLPLAEEFREFFLTSYAVPTTAHKLNCTALRVLFIWRHDYLAHPRNPQGSISRKVENERELMDSLQREYPLFHVRGSQIDLFDMQKQLSLVASTDVMIGMHGAGLTHALFLPPHAGLIELLPSYWSAANDHFYAIAQWRHLVYERWVNEDPENEVEDMYTRVPADVISGLVRSVVRGMCGGHRGDNSHRDSGYHGDSILGNRGNSNHGSSNSVVSVEAR